MSLWGACARCSGTRSALGLIALLALSGCVVGSGPRLEGWTTPMRGCEARVGDRVISFDSAAPLQQIPWPSAPSTPRLVHLLDCSSQTEMGTTTLLIAIAAAGEQSALPAGSYPVGSDLLSRRNYGAEISILLPGETGLLYFVADDGQVQVTRDSKGTPTARFQVTTVRRAVP